MAEFENDNSKYNAEGYLDLTAHEAINRADEDLNGKRYDYTLHLVEELCDLCGYTIIGPVVLKNKRTGKIGR